MIIQLHAFSHLNIITQLLCNGRINKKQARHQHQLQGKRPVSQSQSPGLKNRIDMIVYDRQIGNDLIIFR